MPRRVSSWAKRASWAATRMSAASSSSIPSVIAQPCAAATTGLVQGPPVQPPRVTAALGGVELPRGQLRADIDHVQAPREMVAVGEQDPAPEVVVGLQQAVGGR